MAQRLVRKLCTICKKQIELAGKDKEIIDTILDGIVDKTYLEGVDRTKIYHAVGCDKCNMTGYKGRIGVYEAIFMDESVEQVLKADPSEREIKKASVGQNILDLKQDGVLKILAGTTTLDELERVVDIEK